jgi:hypothetical protein
MNAGGPRDVMKQSFTRLKEQPAYLDEVHDLHELVESRLGLRISIQKQGQPSMQFTYDVTKNAFSSVWVNPPFGSGFAVAFQSSGAYAHWSSYSSEEANSRIACRSTQISASPM